MRAVSAKQRFPVAQWKYDLNRLQETSILMHDKHAKSSISTLSRVLGALPGNVGIRRPDSAASRSIPTTSRSPTPQTMVQRSASPLEPANLPIEVGDELDMGLAVGPGHSNLYLDTDAASTFEAPETRPSSRVDFNNAHTVTSPRSEINPSPTPTDDDDNIQSSPLRNSNRISLRYEAILASQRDSKLCSVEPGFTDSTGFYYRKFENQISNLSGKNSDSTHCIEKFLMHSEKEWFGLFYDAKMGVRVTSAAVPEAPTPALNTPEGSIHGGIESHEEQHYSLEQFALPENYQNPKGIRKLLKVKLLDWPIYAYLLALGQIISANSYQIVLLTGEIGTTSIKIYIIAGVYCAASIFWWVLFRLVQSRYILSLPWALYGLAFLLIGLGPWTAQGHTRGLMQIFAACTYSAASASGGLFFSLNFGSEGSATVRSWGYRACFIQGVQQLYIATLWYWGSRTNQATVSGFSWSNSNFFNSYQITIVTMIVAVLLWFVGTTLYIGLPDYYRQAPEEVPSFYKSVLGRKVVLWFFFAVCVQNLFLSAQTGRNWAYLWTSQHASAWTIALLVVFFFIFVWVAGLLVFAYFSETHSWTLPIFAIGVGAPRWAQILWSTSGMGLWLPWAGYSYLASALVGRILWLWLGVLDSIQSVGFGMILLQTLTRIHTAFALLAAQTIGAIFTILARRFISPDGGPGLVFPNFLVGRWTEGNAEGDWGWGYGLDSAWFWFGLLSQLSICVGFCLFFRKEQLQKP